MCLKLSIYLPGPGITYVAGKKEPNELIWPFPEFLDIIDNKMHAWVKSKVHRNHALLQSSNLVRCDLTEQDISYVAFFNFSKAKWYFLLTWSILPYGIFHEIGWWWQMYWLCFHFVCMCFELEHCGKLYGSHKVFWSVGTVDSTYHWKNMSNRINTSRHVLVVSRLDKKVNMNVVNMSLILSNFALWRIKWKGVMLHWKHLTDVSGCRAMSVTFFIWINGKIHSFPLTFNLFTFIQNQKVFRKTDWKP